MDNDSNDKGGIPKRTQLPSQLNDVISSNPSLNSLPNKLSCSQLAESRQEHATIEDGVAKLERQRELEKVRPLKLAPNPLRQAQQEIFELKKTVAPLKLQVSALTAENEILKGNKMFIEANADSNCYSRKDHGKAIHLSHITATSKSSLILRDLYQCRCLTPCSFPFELVATLSPTMLNKWIQLREKYPLVSLRDIQTLAHRAVPGIQHAPTDKTLEIVSTCGTLALWVHDVNWTKHFEMFHCKVMERVCGKNAVQEANSAVFALPGVRSTETLIHDPRLVYLLEGKEESYIQECLQRREDTRLAILLFRVSAKKFKDEVVNTLQKTMDIIPSEIHVLMVPAYSNKSVEISKAEAYGIVFKKMKRANGTLQKVFLDEAVMALENRTLLSLYGQGPKKYWEAVGMLLEERGIVWPRFALLDESKAATSKKPENETQNGADPSVVANVPAKTIPKTSPKKKASGSSRANLHGGGQKPQHLANGPAVSNPNTAPIANVSGPIHGNFFGGGQGYQHLANVPAGTNPNTAPWGNAPGPFHVNFYGGGQGPQHFANVPTVGNSNCAPWGNAPGPIRGDPYGGGQRPQPYPQQRRHYKPKFKKQ